jgi:hypothetical protein
VSRVSSSAFTILLTGSPVVLSADIFIPHHHGGHESRIAIYSASSRKPGLLTHHQVSENASEIPAQDL